MSKDERSRSAGFLYPEPRRRFVLCRGALRALVGDFLRVGARCLSFPVSPSGKPFAVMGESVAPVSFSVSHSGSHGLVALTGSGRRLGADIEERRDRTGLAGIAETVFGPGENAALASAPSRRRLDRFLTIWTSKEAILKAFGTGWSHDGRSFDVAASLQAGNTSAIWRYEGMPDVEWRIDVFGTEEYAAAIAQELPPRCRGDTDPAVR